MLRQKKWSSFLKIFFMVAAIMVIAPEKNITTAEAAVLESVDLSSEVCSVSIGDNCGTTVTLSSQEVWKNAYYNLMYAEECAELRNEIAKMQELDLQLMANATDHIVSYHGRRFAITDDEYQVLLKIVEAEAEAEDIKGKMLVANVVLNRMECGFGGYTISDVVFARNQFEPISNGRFFRVTPSESTIEAVERVLKGEDESQGALYFMSRTGASWSGVRWFDNNLKFLFKHGGHEFYTEKD